MYETINLDKSLYEISGKSFTQALSDLDPDADYAGTDMEALDAFERQLKRFDIKVCGENSDRVEKFFQNSETAVLFPEYVRRAIRQGMDGGILGEIVAASSKTNALDYRGFTVASDEAKPYTTGVSPEAELPVTAVSLSADLVNMVKYGRLITASYEAIRQQRLDAFAVALRAVGAKLAAGITAKAAEVLMDGAEEETASELTYEELVNFWSTFGDYKLTTILAAPETIAKILSFEQMKYCGADFTKNGMVKTPFGATLVKCSSVPDGELIGLDRSCALEMVQSAGLILENDKLISRQLSRTAVTFTAGFSKIIEEAVRVFKVTE